MWVVKLGGSLSDSDCLAAWLDTLAGEARPVVVVAGGGRFADQVRVAQRRWSLDDERAHVMALLAMEQSAHMLCAINPAYRVAHDIPAIRQSLADGVNPVWLPSRMVLNDSAVEASWRVTSDSLALYLGRRLAADGVLLVKSAPLPDADADIRQLQRADIVDAAFDEFTAAAELAVHLVHRDDVGGAREILHGGSTPGVRMAG